MPLKALRRVQRRIVRNKISDDESKIEYLRQSNLIDVEEYLQPGEQLEDVYSHYYFSSSYETRKLNFLFDDGFYLDTYPDVKSSGIPPLLHFLMFGEKEGRNPSRYFDTNYVKQQMAESGLSFESPFCYYVLGEGSRLLDPIRGFNTKFYLANNSDIRNNDIHPYKHYLNQGINEQRVISLNPKVVIPGDTQEQLLDNLVLWSNGHLKIGGAGFQQTDEVYLSEGDSYEDLSVDMRSSVFDEKLIAFYLPQFYPFKENNKWWGKGFTEWRNVTRARPRFEGHYQPRLPKDMGYYDLRNVEVMKDQVELAKKAGIHGFCFYYYWFNGQKLLDVPVNNFVNDESMTFPYCLMWANENWTRTWDGFESNVLMRQDYREEDDYDLVADWAYHFKQKNYINVDGKPLFIIYRPALVKNAEARVNKWRKLLKNDHDIEVKILMVQGFGDEDPRPYGLDGAIEFPPHKIASGLPAVCMKNLQPGFSGHYIEYDQLVEKSIENDSSEFPLIKTLVPSWDNDPRKPNRGYGFVDSTPAKYQRWLEKLIDYANAKPFYGDKFVFVNAWNEWAEGAYLEPDVYYGAAYLNATSRAIENASRSISSKRYTIAYVGHDAHKHGAQLLSLNIVKQLHDFGVHVVMFLLEGGSLVDDYRKYADVVILDDETDIVSDINLKKLNNLDVKSVITNTVVTGKAASLLKNKGFNVLSLVHELPKLITEYGLESNVESLCRDIDNIYVAADAVKNGLAQFCPLANEKVVVQPQGLYQKLAVEKGRDKVFQELGVPLGNSLVVGTGYADKRKGFDIFLKQASLCSTGNQRLTFLWVGDISPEFSSLISDAPKNFLHKSFTKDVIDYVAASDIYFLSSREDPFPSSALEALGLGLPVVAIKSGGGVSDLIENNASFGVVYTEEELLSDSHLFEGLPFNESEERIKWAEENLNWRDYVFGLLEALDTSLKRVSVVIPNYNYASYLPERLSSIFNQSYPIYEILFLEDCSPDDSLQVAKAFCLDRNREIQFFENEVNSGNVFKQWHKGAGLASGEYLWFAEADDAAHIDFVRLCLPDSNDVVMSIANSEQVDEDGKHLAKNYNYYFDEEMKESFELGTKKASEFVSGVLSVKNQIMNVSGCLFRSDCVKYTLDKELNEMQKFKVAGDWYLYCNLLTDFDGYVKLESKSLNVHRRHSSSVTHSNLNASLINEIASVQSFLLKKGVSVNRDRQMKYLGELSEQFDIN